MVNPETSSSIEGASNIEGDSNTEGATNPSANLPNSPQEPVRSQDNLTPAEIEEKFRLNNCSHDAGQSCLDRPNHDGWPGRIRVNLPQPMGQ